MVQHYSYKVCLNVSLSKDMVFLFCTCNFTVLLWVTNNNSIINIFSKTCDSNPLFPLFRIPNSQKHRNAFSPNFIHSLDSCHMMMTGLHCEQSNITFVSVHDCYWVHAKNVNAMSKVSFQLQSFYFVQCIKLSRFLPPVLPDLPWAVCGSAFRTNPGGLV